MTSIRPTGHHLIVSPLKIKEKTESGIIVSLEGSSYEKLNKSNREIGEVLAMGPQAYAAHRAALWDYAVTDETVEAKLLDNWCQVGDMVFYSRNSGRFVFDPMSGEELYAIHDEDVIAVIPPEAEWKHDIRELRI